MRATRLLSTLATVGSLVALLGLAACSNDGREMREPRPDQTLSIVTTTTAGPIISGGTGTTLDDTPIDASLTLVLPWETDGAIDARYTCTGQDISPRVAWTGVPAGTTEVALAMTDLDAAGFVHWIVAGLDPQATGLDEGTVPPEVVQARNGFGTTGYRGPCPPSGTHTYQVTLYALAEPSSIAEGSDPAEALRVLEGNQIEALAVTGTFGL